jgi:hypothetical protein
MAQAIHYFACFVRLRTESGGGHQSQPAVLEAVVFRHDRINHSKSFEDEKNRISGVDNVWNRVRRVLRQYKGISKNAFFFVGRM